MKSRILFLLFALATFSNNAVAQVTKTIFSNLEIDGGSVGISPFTFTEGVDFPAGSIISDVDVQLQFRKTDGSCARPAFGNAFHEELYYALSAPNSTSISLIQDGTYFGGTAISDVAVTLDDASPTSPSGIPTSGTFKPTQPLSTFNGLSPFGDWSITAGDNAGSDPLCHYQAQVTITVISPLVTLDIAPSSITEEEQSSIITASLDEVSSQDVVVELQFSGSATGGGVDYSATGTSITITAGMLTGTKTITSVSDSLLETDETVVVDISSVTGAMESGTQQKTINITDSNSASASLSVQNNGSETGPVDAVFTVTLTNTNATGSAITFTLNPSGGDATAGNDYEDFSTSVISVANGESIGTYSVVINDDEIYDPNQKIEATISNPSNIDVTIAGSSATTTIADNEALPSISFEINNLTINENGGIATISAFSDRTSDLTTAIAFSRSGTASTSDYVISGTSIQIPAGEASQSITVTGVQDLTPELGGETVSLAVDSVLNGTYSENQQMTISINDNDTDYDTDGLTYEDELLYGTDPLLSDSDNDSVIDSKEVHDGSAPLDRGSSIPTLPTTICSLWNGFLQNPGPSMWNIMEHVNHSNSTIQVSSTLYDVQGVAKSTAQFSIPAGAQYDLLVHAMPGWTLDSYGQVCSTIQDGFPGDLDGRMVYYKPDTFGNFEFAFAIPFSNGIAGSQFVPFNTYQPSLDPADAFNFVSNWIQITNQEDSVQSGDIYFYNQDGTILGQFPITLGPKSRQDFPAHQYGPSKVGLVEFRPGNNTAKFGLQNVRYYHDNSNATNSFDGAIELDGSIGNGQGISVPLDTVSSTSVLEVANTKYGEISVKIEVYDLSGVKKLEQMLNLAPHASIHIIMDTILVNQKGMAYVTVGGNLADSVIATAMQYGYTSTYGIKTLYGIPANQALGLTLRGTYNTFLNQNCTLFVTNPTNVQQVASVSMVRLDGTTVVDGDSLQIPANGGAVYDLCSKDADNSYGVVTTIPSQNNSLYTSIIRQESSDNFRFSTLSRQVTSTNFCVGAESPGGKSSSGNYINCR